MGPFIGMRDRLKIVVVTVVIDRVHRIGFCLKYGIAMRFYFWFVNAGTIKPTWLVGLRVFLNSACGFGFLAAS